MELTVCLVASRRLVGDVVRHGPHREPDLGVVEQQEQQDDHHDEHTDDSDTLPADRGVADLEEGVGVGREDARQTAGIDTPEHRTQLVDREEHADQGDDHRPGVAVLDRADDDPLDQRSDHESDRKVLWRWDETLPDASSPLATEKFLIVPSGFGTVNCLDIKTGKVLWEHDFDVGFSSSPIQVNDRVYLTDYSGNIQIFKLDSQFQLLGTGDVGEDIFATPAFVGDKIYIRGLTHLFCVATPNKAP